MRISLLNNGISYPLAGQSGVSERVHSSAGDLRIAPAAVSDSYNLLGGAYAERADLGNVACKVSFGTTRLFDSPDLAQLWSTDYEARFPRAGILVIEAIAPGGAVSTRHLLNAIVEPPSRQIIGASVLLQYSVEGGEIVPAAAITLYPGITWKWVLQNWESVTDQWQTL